MPDEDAEREKSKVLKAIKINQPLTDTEKDLWASGSSRNIGKSLFIVVTKQTQKTRFPTHDNLNLVFRSFFRFFRRTIIKIHLLPFGWWWLDIRFCLCACRLLLRCYIMNDEWIKTILRIKKHIKISISIRRLSTDINFNVQW